MVLISQQTRSLWSSLSLIVAQRVVSEEWVAMRAERGFLTAGRLPVAPTTPHSLSWTARRPGKGAPGTLPGTRGSGT